MRKIYLLAMLVVAPVLSYSQISFGTYQFSFDWYWKGHTAVFLDLKEDHTYTFKMMDDCSGEVTTGKWKIAGNELILVPSMIPDNVQIYATREKENKRNKIEFYKNNIVGKGIRVDLYSFGRSKRYISNSIGQLNLNQNYDSVKVEVGNKKYVVHESNNFTNIKLKVNINTHYKDLIYRMLGTDRLKIMNNKISVTYFSERHKKFITEFFEKIK